MNREKFLIMVGEEKEGWKQSPRKFSKSCLFLLREMPFLIKRCHYIKDTCLFNCCVSCFSERSIYVCKMTSLKLVEMIYNTGDQEKAFKTGKKDRFDFYKYDKACWISREKLQ